jgi:hypothetical protein
MDEACIVKDNAHARTDMERVSIRHAKPVFDDRFNYVQTKTKEDHPSWYVDGYFVRQE